ncbi:MAG: hypothetical protein A2W23_06955 [Planctomycetes bacterium RBG_16_43_13]|nr:MAG: hypothetical protein A2W23_06955 [Planctomycetes bacterium RBG_16_43_13]
MTVYRFRLLKNLFIIFLLICVSGCAATVKNAQKTENIHEIPGGPSEGLQGTEDAEIPITKPRFIIVPGDELSISVYRNEELNRRILIPPDGLIFFPLVGEIDVVNMSPGQIRKIITDGLSEYIVDPQVSVDPVVIRSQKIFVLGEVNRPGVFFIEGQMALIEALSKAGGFTKDAKSDKVLLIRGDMAAPELQTFDVKSTLKRGDLTQNLYLQRGDILYVPPTYVSNVDRFFKHLESIIRPVVLLEQGIVLYPRVEDAIKGESQENGPPPLVITPP